MTGFDLETFTWDSPATPAKVAIVSSALGLTIGAGLACCAVQAWGYPQLWLYAAVYSLFHVMEFLITAHFNPATLNMGSFLLTNGWQYCASTLASVLEAVIMHVFWPQSHKWSTLNTVGLLFVAGGQLVRSNAMIEAAQSFNHKVAFEKQDGHTLVTTGVYSKVRHPSYTGYYFWSVGTQLLAGNKVCAVLFALILWKFFKDRISREEEALVRFFGQNYVLYRSKVWSGLPFV